MKYTEIGHPGRTANVRDVAPSAPTADAMAATIASLPRAAPPTGRWPYRGHRTVAELDAARSASDVVDIRDWRRG